MLVAAKLIFVTEHFQILLKARRIFVRTGSIAVFCCIAIKKQRKSEKRTIMNEKDMNEEINGAADRSASKPKPLRKLTRIDSSRNIHENDDNPAHEAHPYQPQHEAPASHEYHGRYEAVEPVRGYRGKYEAEPSQEYRGAHEAEPSEEYQGRYAAEPQENFSDADDDFYDDINLYDDDYRDKRHHDGKVVEKRSWTDVLVKTGSIAVSLILIFALVLNMPILWYKEKGQPNERVSIITYFKRWKPLVNVEGPLEKPTQDFNVNPDMITVDYSDGLDLPQLVEGQYTVLFLGFDEEEYNTDVDWVCQFDIAGGKLNILQIPRDTALPDYTSNPTCKFNSIYTWGDQSITPIQRVVNAVQENFGIPIDAYVTTACFDIVDMVDLIGGIPITLDNEIVYEADKIIPAGNVTLSGEQAEWFIRFRHDWLQGDLGRVQNQRRFMAAAMNKLFDIVNNEGRVKLYSYLNTIYKNEWIATDMSVDDLSKLADFASTLSMENVTVNMVPGEGADYYDANGNRVSIYSVHKQATIDMLNEYFRPYQNPMTSSDTALVEYVTDYNYVGFDDTAATLDQMENATEPPRG